MDIFGMIKKLGEQAGQAVGKALAPQARAQAQSPTQQVQNIRNASQSRFTRPTPVDPTTQVNNVAQASRLRFAEDTPNGVERINPYQIAPLNVKTLPTSPAFSQYVMQNPDQYMDRANYFDQVAEEQINPYLPIYLRR